MARRRERDGFPRPGRAIFRGLCSKCDGAAAALAEASIMKQNRDFALIVGAAILAYLFIRREEARARIPATIIPLDERPLIRAIEGGLFS